MLTDRLIIAALLLIMLAGAPCALADEATDLIAAGAKVETIADGYKFTEGPAVDADGNIYFTDIPNNRIHKWDAATGKVSLFRENSGGANGLYFAKEGSLFACEGDNQRVAAIDIKSQSVTVLADKYNGKPFNKPNDLWIDPKGGIYFTDPNYRSEPVTQDGEHVYYLTPDRKKVLRVVDDFVRPNGLIGTPDGKTLYVSDRSGNKTFVYTINADGTLSNKKLFCEEGSDGVTLDKKGNLYITPPASAVHVYDPAGKLIAKIPTPKPPANVCFGGKDRKLLFITARDAVYGVKMNIAGY